MMDKTNQHHKSVDLANLYNIRNQLLNSNNKETNLDKGFEWINIKEKFVMQLILEAFVDPEKKKILNLTSDQALTVPEILGICNIPTTSGYRIINSLEKNGLLVKSYIDKIKNGKKITKYRSIFDNVQIKIEKNDISIKAKFAKI